MNLACHSGLSVPFMFCRHVTRLAPFSPSVPCLLQIVYSYSLGESWPGRPTILKVVRIWDKPTSIKDVRVIRQGCLEVALMMHYDDVDGNN